MCGGGGGGGLDQSTIDLQNYQLAQSKKEEQRLKDEEARQQEAKNAIRVLYGYAPEAYDNMVSQDQKNAIYAYYDNANKKPVLQVESNEVFGGANGPYGGAVSSVTSDANKLDAFALNFDPLTIHLFVAF